MFRRRSNAESPWDHRVGLSSDKGDQPGTERPATLNQRLPDSRNSLLVTTSRRSHCTRERMAAAPAHPRTLSSARQARSLPRTNRSLRGLPTITASRTLRKPSPPAHSALARWPSAHRLSHAMATAHGIAQSAPRPRLRTSAVSLCGVRGEAHPERRQLPSVYLPRSGPAACRPPLPSSYAPPLRSDSRYTV